MSEYDGGELLMAYEIYLRKTPGCGTYGDVEVDIETGIVLGMPKVTTIKFFRPRYDDIYVDITVKRLPGYVSKITENIRKNITKYLNSLQIGESLTLSALWGIALTAMPDLTVPLFSITSIAAGIEPDKKSGNDIDIPFNHVTRGNEENVNVRFMVS